MENSLPFFKTSPLLPILRQENSGHLANPILLGHILLLFSHVILGFPTSTFVLGFATRKLYIFFLFPMHAT